MKKALFLFAVVFLLLAPAFAAIPEKINIQGVLTDPSDGKPYASTTLEAIFRLYDDPTAGNKFWEQTGVTIATNGSGYFNVSLDVSTGYQGVTQSTAFQRPLYMAIELQSPVLLFSPRQPLQTVPYAIMAKNVRGGTISAEGAVPILAVSSSNNGGPFGDCAIAAVSGFNVDAVRGANFFNGVGVRGASLSGVGVVGFGGAAGGSFESASGSGVRGNSVDGIAVEGRSENGFGVVGQAKVSGKAGVHGYNHLGYGVRGVSNNNIGVQGFGGAAGGSFESTNGTGVYASSTNGNALTLGAGGLKIAGQTYNVTVLAPNVGGGTTPTIDKVTGVIYNSMGADAIMVVSNKYVHSTSVIIATPITSDPAKHVNVYNIDEGSFALRLSPST